MDSTGKDAKAANGTDGQPQAEGKGEPKDGLVPAPLGESEVYAKVTADGRLVAIRARIVLREDLGHLYEVEGKVAISSLGYHELNRYAGISLVGPNRVLTPDGERPNPYLEMDPRTGYVSAVWVRRVAFGLSPIGNLAVIDRSFRFDLRTYLLQELTKKAARNKAVGCFLMREQVAEHEAKIGKKGWFITLTDPVGLWVDLAHEEVLKTLENHTQRLRFAERHATSICERNALRAHPAIARSQVAPTGPRGQRTCAVTVFGFRHDLDRKQVERLAVAVAEDQQDRLQVEAAALGLSPLEHEAKTVEGAEDLSGAEPENGDEAGVAHEEGAVSQPAPPASPEEAAADRDALLKQVRIALGALHDPKAAARLRVEHGVPADVDRAPTDRLQKFLDAVSQEVDRRLAAGKV